MAGALYPPHIPARPSCTSPPGGARAGTVRFALGRIGEIGLHPGVTAGGKSSDSGLDGGEGKYHLPRPVPLWRIRFEGLPSCWAGRACQVHPGMKRRTCRRIAKSSIGAAGGNAPFRSLFQHQAERHGARRALASSRGQNVPSPDGQGQSGFKCWREILRLAVHASTSLSMSAQQVRTHPERSRRMKPQRAKALRLRSGPASGNRRAISDPRQPERS